MPNILRDPRTGNRYEPVSADQEAWLTGRPGWVVDDDQSPINPAPEPEPATAEVAAPVVDEASPEPEPEPEPAATATRTSKKEK